MMGKVNFSDEFKRNAGGRSRNGAIARCGGTPFPRSLILSRHSSTGQLLGTLKQIF